jgi:MoxR-like ATPase
MLLDARSRLAAAPPKPSSRWPGRSILGKERQIRLAMACILARGHLLIEDVPGVGKTTLSHTLGAPAGASTTSASSSLPTCCPRTSSACRSSTARAPSLPLPSGPIFAQIILADEINRASPKAQSALLEAMESTRSPPRARRAPLPEPFFVIATQNPMHQVGTFRCPSRNSTASS